MRLSPIHLSLELKAESDADVRLALTEFFAAQASQAKAEAMAAKSRVDSMHAANEKYAASVRDDDSFVLTAPYSSGDIFRAEDAANRSVENHRQIAKVRDYIFRHVCGWRSAEEKHMDEDAR